MTPNNEHRPLPSTEETQLYVKQVERPSGQLRKYRLSYSNLSQTLRVFWLYASCCVRETKGKDEIMMTFELFCFRKIPDSLLLYLNNLRKSVFEYNGSTFNKNVNN